MTKKSEDQIEQEVIEEVVQKKEATVKAPKKPVEKKFDLEESLEGLEVEIIRHPVGDFGGFELENFVEARERGDEIAQGSFADYIKDKHYAGRNVVVVPDLSNQHIEGVELEGVDFSGCKLTGCRFQFINLKGAKFNDADLTGVVFFQADLSNVDMRGADLSNVQFDGYAEEEVVLGEGGKRLESSDFLKGIKFSSNRQLVEGYLKENEEIRAEYYKNKIADKQKEKEAIRKDLEEVGPGIDEEHVPSTFERHAEAKRLADEKYKTLSNYEAYVGGGDNYNAYKELYNKQLEIEAEMQKQREKMNSIDRDIGHIEFNRDRENRLHEEDIPYNIDPSMLDVMHGEVEFDPAYVRGSDKAARDQEKQYVQLERGDVEKYLLALKDNPNLQINEYAKQIMGEKGLEFHEGAKVVADLSPRDVSGTMTAVDLLGLDFTGAQLQEACFCGVNMENANFTKANLSNSIFEGAVVKNAIFKETTARDTNFFHTDLSSAKISDSDFKRAYLRVSNGQEVEIHKSNFDYSDIRNGHWEKAKLNQATFNYADLEGVSLAGADMRKVQMQHAILDKALFNGAKMVQCDLQKSYMRDVQMREAEIQSSILKGIHAKGIDMSESQLDEFVNLEKADLENAMLKHLNAERVNFMEANMEGINAEFVKFKEAQLEGANLKFANLHGAVLEKAKANGVDMSGANLTDVNAKKMEFTEGVARDINARRGNFAEAEFSGADLRGSDFEKAFMEKINLRKAQLENARLKEAKLKEAEMEKAKVNGDTDLNKAEIEGVKGELVNVKSDGQEETISVDQQKERSEKIAAAEQKGPVSKFFGNMLQGMGSGFKKLRDFIKHPFAGRSKLAAVVCAVAGAVIVTAIVASAVVTAGASLAVIAGVVAGGVAVGAAVGGVGGYVASKKMGLTTVVATGVGGVVGLGPGAAMGLAGGVAANHVVKKATGKSIDGHLGDGAHAVGSGLESVGEKIGVNSEQEALLKEKEKAVGKHVKVVREKSLGVDGPDMSEIRLENQLKGKQQEKEKDKVPSIEEELAQNIGPKPKSKVVGKEKVAKKDRVESIDPPPPTVGQKKGRDSSISR